MSAARRFPSGGRIQDSLRLAPYKSAMGRGRLILLVFGLTVLSSVFAPQAAAQATPLTLDDCVRMAVAAPSPLTVARLEQDIAEEGQTVARAGFLPQGTLNADHIYNSPVAGDSRTPSFIPSNAVREFAALATVVQSVDTSGRVRAEYARARANRDIAGGSLAIAERDLRRAVAAAYYQLSLSRKIVEVLEATVGEAADFEDRTMLLVQAGEAARADVVKATAQRARFRRELSAASLDAEVANQTLAAFWTEDVTRPLEIVDVLDDAIPAPPVPAATGVPGYLARPEFRLFDAERRGFLADARRARAGLLPELQLAFQWGVDQSIPGWSFRDRGYAAFASLDFTLFDWSRSTSQIRQAEARADQVEAARAATARQFSMEYQTALARVRDIYEQISLARIQTTASEEDLRLSRVRYEGGEGPALEVVNAQGQVADARSGYYAAVAGYLDALRALEVASGR